MLTHSHGNGTIADPCHGNGTGNAYFQVTIADPSILINSHGNGTVVMGMGEIGRGVSFGGEVDWDIVWSVVCVFCVCCHGRW